MTINFRDEKFIFNEDESREAVRLCTNFLNDMQKQCKDKDVQTFYVMLLFIMHDLTEKVIDNIGMDGVVSMFMKRVRMERVSQDSEDGSNSVPASGAKEPEEAVVK